MSLFHTLAVGNVESKDVIYDVPKSLRFRSSYLSRSNIFGTSPADTSTLKKTFSVWVKRGSLGSQQAILTNALNSASYWYIDFDSSDRLALVSSSSSTIVLNKVTTQVFRDTSAWYHICVLVDTSQAGASERVILYVNNVRVTSFSTDVVPAQNTAALSFLTPTSGTWISTFGYDTGAAGSNLDGYLAEINVIDGQAVSPLNFGQVSADSGQWNPIQYTGTYGTNGFYLNFNDTSSVSALGLDASGNNKTWTPVNVSLTAGATYDSMSDSPTNNFPTFNNLKVFSANLTGSNGLLTASNSTSVVTTKVASMVIPSVGRWYFEVMAANVPSSTANFIGVAPASQTDLNTAFNAVGSYRSNGIITDFASATQTAGASYTSGDVIGVVVDAELGTVQFYKNGVAQGANPSFTYTPGLTLTPFVATDSVAGTKTFNINFGQQPFVYSSAGYQKLSTRNLPIASIKRGETAMTVATYIGNGGNQQIGEYQFPRFNYTIGKSLRFKGVNSYLSRTPSANGSLTTWTWSGWVKRSALGVIQTLFTASTSSSNYTAAVSIDAADTLTFSHNGGAGATTYRKSAIALKDTSNWIHVIVISDTTNATAQNRIRMFVNGSEITSWTTNTTVTQNTTWLVNSSSVAHSLAAFNGGSISNLHNGYLAEVNFVDGQALTASSFGEFDINGYWIPKAYTGTYGTNGFYLPFSDNSALTTSSNVGIGKDFSGNTNYWTTNNISLTAGITYDSMLDTPTDNYATLEILKASGIAATSIAQGALAFITTNAESGSTYGTIAMTAGKWYFEVLISGSSSQPSIGLTTNFGSNTTYFAAYSGDVYIGTTLIATVSPAVSGDVIGVRADYSAQQIQFYKNNVLLVTCNIKFETLLPTVSDVSSVSSDTVYFNFGQRPFFYTPPAGYNGISMSKIAEYTNNLESPDFIWVKSRTSAVSNVLFDSVRGPTKFVFSNLTNAETTDASSIISFNKNGFYTGSYGNLNASTISYVAWMWKVNASQTTNNDGSIQTTVKADSNFGFSVVTYTGTGANATVGHGLGIAPKFVIVKNLDSAGTNYGWPAWHSALAGTEVLTLNSLNARAAGTTYWNSTSPSSTVVSLGTNIALNEAGKRSVMYCFSEIDGFSKFSTYTGNANVDGPFVYCGFKPRFILIKRIDATDSNANWWLYDTIRDNTNTNGIPLYANALTVEATGINIDVLSNGFKVRDSTTSLNASAGIYLFASFAECPFKYATAL
jgi:hypothetical protein